MQSQQKPPDGNNHLSNIVEEKSEVHNISSLKASNNLHHIKVREPLCIFCDERNITIDPSIPLKNQNILIYPCLCNAMMHRDCLKYYLIENECFSCELCKANYAVGKSPQKIIAQITPNQIYDWVKRGVLFLLFIVMIIVFLVYIHSFNSSSPIVDRWKLALDILFGLVLGMTLIMAIMWIWGTVNSMRRFEIEVYCNQTEIGYHSNNSKGILKEYFDHLPYRRVLEMSEMEQPNEPEGENEAILTTRRRNDEYDEDRLSRVLQMVYENEEDSPKYIPPITEVQQGSRASYKIENPNHTSRNSKRTSENTDRNYYLKRNPSFKNKSIGMTQQSAIPIQGIVLESVKGHRKEAKSQGDGSSKGNPIAASNPKIVSKKSVVIEVSEINVNEVQEPLPQNINSSSLEVTIKDPNL